MSRRVAPLAYVNAHCARTWRGIKAARCENETVELWSVFWTIDQRRRKEPIVRWLRCRFEQAYGRKIKKRKGKRERERGRDKAREEKSKRKSFPLVERNTHRFATIQRFARARARPVPRKAGHYATRLFSYSIGRSIGVGAR